MIVAALTVAIVALAVALVALRSALANRRTLTAIIAEQNERALASERSLQELAAHSTSVEQQAADGLDHLRSDLAAKLDAGLAQVQDALAIEVAVQVASLREVEDPQSS